METPYVTIAAVRLARKVKKQLSLPGTKYRFAYNIAHSIIARPRALPSPSSSEVMVLFHAHHDILHVQFYTTVCFSRKIFFFNDQKCAQTSLLQHQPENMALQTEPLPAI